MQDQRIRGPWRPPRHELVLAAVDRAQRHRPSPHSGDPTLARVAAHLGIAWGPIASRRLRPIVERLTRDLGWLQPTRGGGQDRWMLSDAGGERLAGAADVMEELPGSPRHREWHEARSHANARIDALRAELAELLGNVNRLLGASAPVESAEWLAHAEPARDLIEACTTCCAGCNCSDCPTRPSARRARCAAGSCRSPAG